ncbi:hypothetical protein [Mucilaginibacter boryungensis]|uniref:hypothetical protein n=1 Tax=Mucilaginibacter boryungensis TaxID=768480 RepID=UPI001D15F6BE|nr:hypothetical protein [Mucilaginibacter boryungensis]
MLRNAIFSHNLIKGAIVSCSNGIRNHILVNDPSGKWWTTKANDTTAAIEFTTQQPIAFNVLQLQENISQGQRIEKFRLQYQDKGAWKDIQRGLRLVINDCLPLKP